MNIERDDQSEVFSPVVSSQSYYLNDDDTCCSYLLLIVEQLLEAFCSKLKLVKYR